VATALLAVAALLGLSTFISASETMAAEQIADSPSHAMPAAEHAYPAGPNDVVIGAYIVNIQAINFETSSFTADFYLWMRWTNPNLHPDQHFEIMNASESWSAMSTPLEVGPIEQPDGTLYHSFHYQGAFNFKPNLADYPFGTQVLPIVIEGTLSADYAINFIPDTTPVVTDPGLTLPGFTVGATDLETSVFAYATDFGDLGNPAAESYSRTAITMPISHPIWSSGVKFLMPLILVVITASLIFLIPPRLGDARIGLGITGLLTLVAMESGVSNGLPNVDYLMLIDVLYILSYVFIVATIFQAISHTWNVRNDEESLEIRPDWRITVTYLAVYFVACGITTYLFVI
jgi:hypothetical protein